MMDNFLMHQTIFHPIKENSQLEDLLVYPNVTNGILNVELKKSSEHKSIANIDLLDPDGKLVESYGQNYNKVVLDISNHKPGLYYLKVTVGKKTKLFHVIYDKN